MTHFPAEIPTIDVLQMSDGIDRSALIVVCITKRYVEKVTG
jgi:hypothetical protein